MRLGIIAGSGAFPVLAARKAKQKGACIVVANIDGAASPELASLADRTLDIPFGQLSKLLQFFKEESVQGVLLAGTLDHAKALTSTDKLKLLADPKVLKIITGMRQRNATGLLGALIEEIEKEGMRVLPSYCYLEEELAAEGPLSRRLPLPAELEDIQIGIRAAKTLAQLDIGLSVCVRHGAILAVEALEGTDACIKRAGELLKQRGKTDGFVVVKMARPKQDPRYDLPVMGPATIETLKEAGATCMAIEAGWTLLLERQALLEASNRAGIALLGVRSRTV